VLKCSNQKQLFQPKLHKMSFGGLNAPRPVWDELALRQAFGRGRRWGANKEERRNGRDDGEEREREAVQFALVGAYDAHVVYAVKLYLPLLSGINLTMIIMMLVM